MYGKIYMLLKLKWSFDVKNLISKQSLKEYILMFTGTFLAALAYACFFVPYDIAPGGVGGLSVILSKYVPLKVGMLTLILNIPIFIFALKQLGVRFVGKTLVLLVFMSLLIDYLPFTVNLEDKFLSVICGGILMGLGLGLVMHTGTSTGGTDTLAMALNKKFPNIKASEMLLFLDAGVVIAAAFAFGVVTGIYSAVAVFMQMLFIDFVFDGINSSRAVYIITKNPEELKKRLYDEINRGVTQIDARGGFTGNRTNMLLCIVSKRQLAAVKRCVKETDPGAFMFDMHVKEVIGKGFNDFE